jgi:predicted CoA-binding protein
MTLLPSAKSLRAIFAEIKSIAVVGLSPKKHRPSHQVARYLMEAGYTIIPVNPGQDRILDMQCYPDLLSIDRPVEVVDIFRRPEFVESVVRDAITIGAKVIWMQQGIVNERAATIAEQAGLQVIMDRCMKVDHMQFADVL